MDGTWSWLTIALLGAYHGVNPAMGWLFAVALGMQERRRETVIRAIGPIGVGHAISIAMVVIVVAAAQTVVSPDVLRLGGAGLLIAFGIYKLLASNSHPRWVGLRVGARDLVAWSFLMSTAHGAGLMLVPLLLRLPNGSTSAASAGHPDQAMAMGGGATGWLAQVGAVGVHSGAMLVVMGLIAVIVYEKVGLMILKRAWVNLDRVWAGALLAAGLVTVVAWSP